MLSRPRTRRMLALGVVVLVLIGSWRSWGRSLGLFEPARPRPDIANIRYGPHDRNVLDLWKAKPSSGSDGPTPVVIFFHGGGFRTGDKLTVPARLIEQCLAAGISVASANYRLSATAAFPAPMLDGARAIQFVRKNAGELRIDPERIAAAGSSAGAGIALWVGFHDDLADPASDDAVARQSSRVTCLGVDGAQTSYDPRFIKTLIGGRAHEHPALMAFYGIKSHADLDSPTTHKLFEDASPINYVSSDDPPAILFYVEPNAPLPADAKAGQGIHHPRFGEALQAALKPLHIECIVRHRREYRDDDNPNAAMSRDMTSFFVREFKRRSGS
jgi:acetyl esterase